MPDIFEISPLDEGEIEKLHKEIREITKLLEDDYRSAGGDKGSS